MLTSSPFPAITHRSICFLSISLFSVIGFEQMAILVLFNAATLDGWTDGLYTGMYGCAQYMNGNPPGACNVATVTIAGQARVQLSPPNYLLFLLTFLRQRDTLDFLAGGSDLDTVAVGSNIATLSS